MKTLIQQLNKVSAKQLYITSILLGLLFAIQIQYIQHGWINPDSVLYFESARLFAAGDWQAAVNTFPWPLYSILIACTHKITGLDIHASAQLLSVIFFGIVTASFLKIIQIAGGTIKSMFAGTLILFSSHYLAGGVLEMLLRDQGFWAFYLASLLFFIRFYKFAQQRDALLWQVCAILATLFRIEAISYLILLPLVLLLQKQHPWKQRIHLFVTCNSLNIVALLSIFSVLLFSEHITIEHFGRLKEVFTTNLVHELTQLFSAKSTLMSQQVLGKYLEEFAVPGLLLTFIYVMLMKTISSAGIVNIALAALSIKHKPQLIDRQTFEVLSASAIVAILNMALIITKVFVLSGRYVLALALVIMLLAALYLGQMLERLTSGTPAKQKWLTYAILIFLLLSLVKNILPKADGYHYQQDAVSWLKQHNPDNKPVFYSEPRLRYYANEPFNGLWLNSKEKVESAIADQSIQQYDYLVISLSNKHPADIKRITEILQNFYEIKRFNDVKAVKFVVIYRKNQLNNTIQ
ncbi:MAG: hypothetical protein VW395_07635 [Methylotenera sp.]